ncbi:MAG: zf-HC2 domain-containing protein [Butyrivibrio sp.]|nr:zf-HC2 domain-containing protein [Butyrivibrio sp.]
MKTDKCDIIQDLLPLYADKGLSQASRDFVEDHLPKCEECRRLYERMKKDITITTQQEQVTAPINRMKKNAFRKAVKAFISIILTLSFVVSLLAVYFSWPMLHGFTPVDQDNISFSVENGCAVMIPDEIAQNQRLRLIYETHHDGEITMYVSYGDIKAQYLFSLKEWYFYRLDWIYTPWEITEDYEVAGGPHIEDGRGAGATTIETPTKICFSEQVTEIYYVPILTDHQLSSWTQLIDRNRKKMPEELSPGLISTEEYDYSTLKQKTLIWKKDNRV